MLKTPTTRYLLLTVPRTMRQMLKHSSSSRPGHRQPWRVLNLTTAACCVARLQPRQSWSSAGVVYGVALGLAVSPLLLVARTARPRAVCSHLVAARILPPQCWWLQIGQPDRYRNQVPRRAVDQQNPDRAAAAGVCCCGASCFAAQMLVGDSIIWWVLAYLLVAFTGLIYATEPNRTYYLVEELVKQAIVLVVVANLLSTARSFRLAMWMLLALGALLGTLSVVQEVTDSYNSSFGGLARMEVGNIARGLTDRPRAGGTTGSPNIYGQQLVVLVPIGIWGALYGRGIGQRLLGCVRRGGLPCRHRAELFANQLRRGGGGAGVVRAACASQSALPAAGLAVGRATSAP